MIKMAAAATSNTSTSNNNNNNNESKLSDLLSRATALFGTTSTGSSSIDEFCALVKSEPEGPQITLRLLSHKLQSPVESEAMAALDVLQRCVETCGPSFHAEIGKFRFLNEIVKVISPKYFGVYTSARVKDRCVEMMYGWTKTLKNEPKIAEAFEMLRKQGLLRVDPAHKELEAEAAKKAAEAEKQRLSAASAGSSSAALGLPEVPRKSISNRKPILDDERAKTLKLLLQSKKPEDLQAANQLIKESLKQDEERVERHTKRHTELEVVRNNMTLLTDMLDHYEESLRNADERTPRNSSSESQDADVDVMAELYMMLDKHRPALFRMASEVEDTEDDMLAALLRANDELLEVLARYRHLVNGEQLVIMPSSQVARPCHTKRDKKGQDQHQQQSYLVEMADLMTNNSNDNSFSNKASGIADLLTQELAAVGINATSSCRAVVNNEEAKTAFKEFSTKSSSSSSSSHQQHVDSELISLETGNNSGGNLPSVQKLLDSLQGGGPLLMTTAEPPIRRGGNASSQKQPDALDLLGREVIQKHLPPAPNNKTSPTTSASTTNNSSREQPTPNTSSTCLLDSDLVAAVDIPPVVEKSPSSSSPHQPPSQRQHCDLNELTFSLDRFRPLPASSPIALYQRNGINVLLLLHGDTNTKTGSSSSNLPSNVKVFLVSSTSMATDQISNFKMAFSVHAKQSNICQIRPLEASASSLAPFNAIVAPAVVTQLILASFTDAELPESLKLRFEVSYRLRDTCYSESGIEEIPLFFN